MLELHTESDPRVAAQKAALTVGGIIAGYKDLPVLFLVSGGSPLEILKYLSPDSFERINPVTSGISSVPFPKVD